MASFYVQLFVGLLRVLKKLMDKNNALPIIYPRQNIFCILKENLYVIESTMDGHRYF